MNTLSSHRTRILHRYAIHFKEDTSTTLRLRGRGFPRSTRDRNMEVTVKLALRDQEYTTRGVVEGSTKVSCMLPKLTRGDLFGEGQNHGSVLTHVSMTFDGANFSNAFPLYAFAFLSLSLSHFLPTFLTRVFVRNNSGICTQDNSVRSNRVAVPLREVRQYVSSLHGSFLQNTSRYDFEDLLNLSLQTVPTMMVISFALCQSTHIRIL